MQEEIMKNIGEVIKVHFRTPNTTERTTVVGRCLGSDSGFLKLRQSRMIADITIDDIVNMEKIDIKNHPQPGLVYHYDYCRGSAYEGIALCRGVDGHEAWMWSVPRDYTATNHMGHRNFVIPRDEEFMMVSVEVDAELGNL